MWSAAVGPSRHRLAGEAAALIQPTLGVQVVPWSVATSGEVDRTQLPAAPIEPRRGGPVPDALRGLLSVVVGREATGLREGCAVAGDDPPVVGAAVVLEDDKLNSIDAGTRRSRAGRASSPAAQDFFGAVPMANRLPALLTEDVRPESEKGLGAR